MHPDKPNSLPRSPALRSKITLIVACSHLAPCLMAADSPGESSWHAQTLVEALGHMLLFAVVGIAAAIVGYKLFDKCTPGDLHQEILQNRNVAAAIVAGAVVLGVCIIIAASMLG